MKKRLLLRLQGMIKQRPLVLAALLALACTVPSFGNAPVVLLEAMTGPSSHISLFKEQLEQRLVASSQFKIVDRSSIKTTQQEVELSKSEWTSDNNRQADLKIGDLILKSRVESEEPNGFRLYVSLVDIKTLEIKYSASVNYQDESFIPKVAAHVVEELEMKMGAKPAESTNPFQEELFLKTEKNWMKLGYDRMDWQEFYKTGAPLTDFYASQNTDQGIAMAVAAIPGWSGMNYTRDWAPGMAFALTEAVLIFYGFVEKDKSLKTLSFSALIPIGIFDIMFSKKSARRNLEKVNSLKEYYRNNPREYKFMGNN